MRAGPIPFPSPGNEAGKKQPPAEEEKPEPPNVELFRIRIPRFIQERQGNAEKLPVIRLQTSPEALITVKVFRELRQGNGQFINILILQKKGVRFDVFKTSKWEDSFVHRKSTPASRNPR